jgi:hypothetical protein
MIGRLVPWKPQNPADFPSLGWDVLEWLSEYLPSPRDPDKQLLFTDEQALQIVEWYRLDVKGRRVYRRGYSRRSKGWGKSPLEAGKVIAELAGPVRFAGWDADGQPVGRPWGTASDPNPWVQVGAVSEDQTDNTWSVVHAFLTENDGRAADVLRIDAGLTRCFLRDRPGKAEPVTASAGSREGQPITYAVLDESHLWTPRNGGVKLASTLRRNVGKMDGTSYETTNSFVPGEGSVAEASSRAVRVGAPGVFADEVEAPREVAGHAVTLDAPDDVLLAALDVAYGGSWWVDRRRLIGEVRDPDTRWTDACRFFFNWNSAAGSTAVDAARWDELLSVRDVAPGSRVALGFDGSISDDTTALIGCTDDGHLFVVGMWERPRFDDGRPVPGWRVPRVDVGAAVRAAFGTWDVGAMVCDPPRWSTEIESWQAEFGDRVQPFETFAEAKFSKLVDRWLSAIANAALSHSGDPRLTAHVLAARLKKLRASADEADGRTRYVLVKGDDGRKIDAAIAAVLAFEGAAVMGEVPESFFVY